MVHDLKGKVVCNCYEVFVNFKGAGGGGGGGG
jgi:hypothetical protein